MKRQLSLLMLGARSSLWRVLGILAAMAAAQTAGGIGLQIIQGRRVDGRFHKILVPGIDEPLVQLVQHMVDMLPQRGPRIFLVPDLIRDAVHDVLRLPQRADGHLGNDRFI